MNKEILDLLRSHNVDDVRSGLEVLDNITQSVEECMLHLGVSEEYPIQNFQDLFTWAGGQFVHHMFISWWLLARFAGYDEDWAQSNHSVSLRGVVTKRCTFPPEVSTLRLHVLDVSSNSLETRRGDASWRGLLTRKSPADVV